MKLGTTVTNPMRRPGETGYSMPCQGCKLVFTRLGIARHWPKCKGLEPRLGGGFQVKKD